MKPPKNLRLSDDWLWNAVKALYGIEQSVSRSGTWDVHHVRVDPVADSAMPRLLR